MEEKVIAELEGTEVVELTEEEQKALLEGYDWSKKKTNMREGE